MFLYWSISSFAVVITSSKNAVYLKMFKHLLIRLELPHKEPSFRQVCFDIIDRIFSAMELRNELETANQLQGAIHLPCQRPTRHRL